MIRSKFNLFLTIITYIVLIKSEFLGIYAYISKQILTATNYRSISLNIFRGLCQVNFRSFFDRDSS